MSLAERPRTRVAPTGIGARRGQGWVDEFRVERQGLRYRCPKQQQEEETLPTPVDSKDLFREASNLPTSEDLQLNFGRFLHRYRNNIAHYAQGSIALKTAVQPAATEWVAPEPDRLRELLTEVKRALGETPTSPPLSDPSKFLSILQKAIESIESRKAPAIEAPVVLESFDGYVNSIDGDTAYVTLESRLNGEVLYGEYSAQELLSKGIHEQTRFLCETVKGGGGVGRVHFAPLPKNQVTDEEARSIAKEMREAFPGDDDSVIEY